LWNKLAPSLSSTPSIVGAVIYGNASSPSSIATSSIPSVHHLAGKAKDKLQRSADFTAYDYPSIDSHLFATPFQKSFNYSTESVSHTRSLTFLKKLMDGPFFDLEAIWDEHTYYEFGDRSVEQTMATMVQEPYVNHIPTVSTTSLPSPLQHKDNLRFSDDRRNIR
jgi:carboxymethylenebutenolidase